MLQRFSVTFLVDAFYSLMFRLYKMVNYISLQSNSDSFLELWDTSK